ncbi:MAG: hypothetical protein ACO1O1_10280 [Adhaeribacter sp.]
MKTLTSVQKQIRQHREGYRQADQAYYEALQAWSLSQRGQDPGLPPPSQQELVKKGKQRHNAWEKLQAATAKLYLDTSPQQLLGEVPASLPFLLLPLRMEARYLTLRHVVRHLKPEDALDVSTNVRLSARYRHLGFEKDEEGVLTYQVQSWHLSGGDNGFFNSRVRFAELRPPSGRFIRRKNDDRELRLRFYPDDVQVEGHERALQVEEEQAGRRFWEQVGAGADARQAWRRLALASTPARGAWIVRATRPLNAVPGQPPPAQPEFPAPGPYKDGAYTLPPAARLLPDRLVVRLYKDGAFKEFTGKAIPEPLVLGLDPTQDPFDQDPAAGLGQQGAGLSSPEYLRWVHQFEAAEAVGMALRINLNEHPEYSTGVDKILVLGAKLSAGEEESANLWEALLENHLYKEEGLGVVPPGTPTNNFEHHKAGYNQREQEADRYFESEWGTETPAPLETDEARLKKILGLGASFRLPGGRGTDLSEGALFNEMLWPATWGYYLLQFFSPQLEEATREQVRRFFLHHVSARGLLPVLRVNRQPYGLLPVTSWAHWGYGAAPQAGEEQLASFLWSRLLAPLLPRWQALAAGVRTVNAVGGRGLDDAFIEMLGVSPSAGQLQRGWVAGLGFQEVMRAAQQNPAADTGLGADPDFRPAAFERELAAMGLPAPLLASLTGAYNGDRQQVRRIFLDGLPVAEDRPLELIAGKAWNYLDWLSQARLLDIWHHDFSAAPAGAGATDSSAGVSALAVLLRQAVLRAYLEAGMQVAEPQPGLWLLKVKDFEAQHLHLEALAINPAELSPENKLHQAFKPIIDRYGPATPFVLEPDRRQYFNRAYPATGSALLADWLEAEKLGPAVPQLQGVMQALRYFRPAASSRLSRLFTEHLDLCSHRLDAWLAGLVSQRIEKMRQAKPRGLYLGAFGYLLGLQPAVESSVVFVEEEPEYLPAEPQNLNQAALPVIHAASAKQQGLDPGGPGWDRAFFYIGNHPTPRVRLNTGTGQVEPDELINLASGDGFVHAPSGAHATAAAILRAGFLNHQADNQTALLQIQLNSPRVRQALQLLEGMQQGAALGELLGYHFERLLHDHHLDAFLLDLRAAFPLSRTQVAGASPSPLTALDGLALLASRRRDPANPTGWLDPLPGLGSADAATKTKVNDLAEGLENQLDALADLLVAESVYQTARGNKDRAAAALRILHSGGQVVPPDLVRSPLKGGALTHRVGLVFRQLPATGTKAGWTAAGSARSRLSPDLNAWLCTRLPEPQMVFITWKHPQAGQGKVNLQEMALEPLDLLYALPATLAGAEASPFGLYAQLTAQQKAGSALPPGASLALDFADRSTLEAGEMSLRELASLVAALHKTVQEARPLSPNDFLMPDRRAAGGSSTDAGRLKAALAQHPAAPAGLAGQLRGQAQALEMAIAQGQPTQDWQPLEQALLPLLLQAWQQGGDANGVDGKPAADLLAASRLALKATEVAAELEARRARALEQLQALDPASEGGPLFAALQQVAATLFNSTLPLFPDLKPENMAEVKASYQGRELVQNAAPEILDAWMQEAALVRRPLRSYRHATLLAEILAPPAEGQTTSVLQLPFYPGQAQAWIGGKLPPESPASPRASLSLLLDLPDTFDPEVLFSGFVVDEWPEWLPEKTVDTGVAFQYNQPNTEPPQALLLAVAPVEEGNWAWDHLAGAVHDALDMARIRLVSPLQVQESSPGLNQLLPAILLPFMPENLHTPVVEPL